ncbi:hypothetical protein D0T23_14025 [Duganella sp. BJB475]|nr:hypothetical protein D0T23_14025 [Duganella sp. BJB475]RFP36244.1 hypothetical protein D0T21_07380 [Duganella sp. BJB476]
MQGAAFAVATASCGLIASRHAKSLLASDQAINQGTPAQDLSALVRSGQSVPVEQFFSSPENFAHFLKLTGAA